MQLCNVCSDQVPKYRCPTCLIRYCSMNCFKTHKDSCEPVNSKGPTSGQNQSDTAAREAWTPDDLLDGDDKSDMVPVDILKKLGESEDLKDLLRNPHLRQVLAAVDTAGNKMDIMKTAMQEPLFMEFADQCLKIVEPTDSEDV
ncbi:zinc finger HIT domain-containing protein 3 [Clupea harengus]|uniref:Zinc finger HIT domain-containing protein 3 n=1 Tax=Clupea harengus TaxID=7950 RepID=A0A6P3W0X8_CLUHA|nr:zinc finger HIT domain-containing protein 3 [Clupea harengus]